MRFFSYLSLSIMLFVVTEGISQSAGWTYIPIDSTKQKWGDWDDPEWLRYFGVDHGDVNGDGNLDIISGRYIYINPGGDMTSEWARIVLDDNVDGILFMDVDGDPYADIIAQSLPEIYWYEAQNLEGTIYQQHKVTEVPATGHVNSQGFEKAQIIKGGNEEILIAGNGDVYVIEIPTKKHTEGYWKTTLIGRNTSDEGIGVGDVDGDGDLDIATGRRPEGENEPSILVWFENPGYVSGEWKATEIAHSDHPIDRIDIADLDGDEKADIVYTEERYPGLEPDGHMVWYKQLDGEKWKQNIIVQQYSINNLDIADMDGDGDLDLITNEHKGPNLELQLWKNDGRGNFKKEILDTGKENHLGTQLADLDGDGDLDIYGGAWDNYKWMHVWRNDELQGFRGGSIYKEYKWTPADAYDEGGFLRVGGRYDYKINPDHFPADKHQNGFISMTSDVDLTKAIRAELIVEKVQSHEDTRNLSVKINQGPWMKLPDLGSTPDDPNAYMFHHNPRVNVPLSLLKSGEVKFKFKVDTIQKWNWPQNVIYGVILKVYYEDDKTSLSPKVGGISDGDILTDKVALSIADVKEKFIKKVDYVGFYNDVDFEGGGVYTKWQYNYYRGQLANHIGTSVDKPFSQTWETSWVPDQAGPLKVTAIVTLKDGLKVVTPEVDDLTLSRDYSIQLIRPFDISKNWVTREPGRGEKFIVPVSPKKISQAKLYWRSWSPCYSEGIRINGNLLEADKSLPCYDYYEHAQDVNPDFLIKGTNHLTTVLTPFHHGGMVHGMEVQWPGMMLKLKTNKKSNSYKIVEATYDRRPHFIIATPEVTYYYDKMGGGFSRIIDMEGNDWVSFKVTPWDDYPAAAASSFRGLPNLVFKTENKGAGHPGHDRCKTEIVDARTIKSTTIDNKWSWTWKFSDSGAVLSVDKTDGEEPYWFLYEGTPGGKYNPQTHYFGTNLYSSTSELPDFYNGKTSFDELSWFYAGDSSVNRVFYCAHLTPDNHLDLVSYLGNEDKGLESKDGMTVFGFGRNQETTPLMTGKNKFAIGFYDGSILSDAAYDQLKNHLNNSKTNQ